MKKRVLSLALSLCMAVSLLSTAAFATDEPLPDSGAQEPTDMELVIPAEPSAEDPAEVPAEPPAEEIVEVPAEEPAEVSEEVPAEEPAEIPTVEATAPEIIGFELRVDGETYTAQEQGGSLALTLPADTALADAEIKLTVSEAVAFQPADAPEVGKLYVATAGDGTAGLNFNVSAGDVDLSSAEYRISLESADGVTWNGTMGNGFAAINAGMLATALAAESGVELVAGAMQSTTTQTLSNAWELLCNQDAENVTLYACDAETAVYTVTYVYGEGLSYTWKVPAGAALVQPKLADESTLLGWYDGEQAVSFGTPVTANLTLYAKFDVPVQEEGFGAQLDAGAPVLNITTDEDWTVFLARSGEVTADQRVELEKDIDCGGASHMALPFHGDFNGNNHTISNGTFTANGENSGLFAAIGAGQTVCNLTLSSLTVKNATYSGALAGSISGTEGNRALVQNIQVRGGTVNGRSAGGVAGYVFFADVKYCSCRTTTISGQANGAGIAGINYGVIRDCYSVCSPSAFPLAGKVGGIVGKNLEGGLVDICWCSHANVAGQTDDSSTTTARCMGKVTSRISLADLELDSKYWNTAKTGSNTDFTDAVRYEF